MNITITTIPANATMPINAAATPDLSTLIANAAADRWAAELSKVQRKKHAKLSTINADNIMTHANMVAYVAMRTIANKSGNKLHISIRNAIAANDSSNHDANDVIQTAALALWEYIAADHAIIDDADAHAAAYKAVNKHIYNSRAVRGKVTTYYIDEYQSMNGEIEDLRRTISHILNGIVASEKLSNIIPLLSERQKTVCKFMSYGYSQTQISAKMRISTATVSQHALAIRRKAFTIYPNGIDA